MLGKVGINHQVSFKAQQIQDLSNCFTSPNAIKARPNQQTPEGARAALQPNDWNDRGASAKREEPTNFLTGDIGEHEMTPETAQRINIRRQANAADAEMRKGYAVVKTSQPATTRKSYEVESDVLNPQIIEMLGCFTSIPEQKKTQANMEGKIRKQQRQDARDAIRGQFKVDIGPVQSTDHERGQYPVSNGSEVPVKESYLEHVDSRSTKGNTPQGYMPGVVPGQLSEQDKLEAEMAQGLTFPRRSKPEPKVEPPTVKVDPSRYDTGYGNNYMPL